MVGQRAMIRRFVAFAGLAILLGVSAWAQGAQHPSLASAPPLSGGNASQPGYNRYTWTDVDDARREYTPPFAFPGAEGFGTDTPGGRGGTIVRVNTLQDSLTIDAPACLDEDEGTPCSLRSALHPRVVNTLVASGACADVYHCPRIVVFEVGGTISMVESLGLSHPFLTMAGQTAPHPGINLVGGSLLIQTHDLILQHITIRSSSCLEEPVTYCQVTADCPGTGWKCARYRCRLVCEAGDDQFCADNGYGGLYYDYHAACVPYSTQNVCTCHDTHGIVLAAPSGRYYSQFSCLLEGWEKESDLFCLPRDRGSTAESVCQCGEICHHLDRATGCPCDPDDATCCSLPATVAETYGCDFDSDCDPLQDALCAGLGSSCSVGCMAGYCTPLPLPNLEQEIFNVVVDHVSLGWGNDEVVGMADIGVHDITVSNSIVALGENVGSAKVAVPHALGLLVGPGIKRVAVLGNLFAHQRARNPDLEDDVSAVVANNVIYNPESDAISHPAGRRLGPTLAWIGPNLMVTGPDSLLVPEIDSNGLVVGTEFRVGQFGFDYLVAHDIVTTVDDIPSMMPVVHAWHAVDPESELWIGYRRTPLDSLYSEWGSAFSPVYTNTAVLQANTCPGGDPDYLRWRSGGPSVFHFPLDGTVQPPVGVSPLTLFDTCEELLRSVVANVGARPRDRDPVDSDVVASLLSRTGQILDEVICTDTEAGVLCDAWRCDSPQGCTTLWSWTMPGPAARRILPPPENPDDCPVFVPGDPSTYPDPLAGDDLVLPCNLDETDAEGYTRLDWWLHVLSEGLNGTVDPALLCPGSARIYLPLVLR